MGYECGKALGENPLVGEVYLTRARKASGYSYVEKPIARVR